MTSKSPEELPLEPEVEAELKKVLSDVRDLLLSKASYFARGRAIDREDIGHAYELLGFPDRAIQDAQTIITQTLRENRMVECGAYGMALVMFATGIALLCAGVFGSPDLSLRVTSLVAGSLLETLLFLPVRLAINSRRHNIAIRMLGILLDRVHDPKKLGAALNETFLAVVLGRVPEA